MMEIKDFVTIIQSDIDNFVLSELKDKMLKVGYRLGITINEEKCKDWIKQAIELETYSPEQIEDLAIRNIIYKKDKEIKHLKNQVEYLETLLNSSNSTYEEPQGYGEEDY